MVLKPCAILSDGPSWPRGCSIHTHLPSKKSDGLLEPKCKFTHFGVYCGGQTTTPGTNLVYAWFDNVQYNLAPDLMDSGASDVLVFGYDEPKLELTWIDDADGETGFLIARSIDGANWRLVGYAPANATSFMDIDPTLMPETVYYYRVAAYNENTHQMSRYAEAQGITGLYVPPPAQPKALVVHHLGANWARVLWTNADPPADQFARGFVIERLVDGRWTLVREHGTTAPFSFDDMTISDTVVFPAQYRVAATNESGFSPYQYSIQIKAPQGIPQFLGIIDHYNDWTKAVRQAGWQIVPTPAAAEWDYDPGLAERTTDASDAEIVYFLPNQQLTTFNLKLFYQTAYWDADKLKFYGSADGVTYTEIPNTVAELEDKSNGWRSARATPAELIPSGLQ